MLYMLWPRLAEAPSRVMPCQCLRRVMTALPSNHSSHRFRPGAARAVLCCAAPVSSSRSAYFSVYGARAKSTYATPTCQCAYNSLPHDLAAELQTGHAGAAAGG